MKKLLYLLATALFFQTCTPSKPDPQEVRKKVGQMFLLAFSRQDAETVLPFIKERGIGGLYLNNENLSSPTEAATLLNKLQEASINGLAGLPLLTRHCSGRCMGSDDAILLHWLWKHGTGWSIPKICTQFSLNKFPLWECSAT